MSFDPEIERTEKQQPSNSNCCYSNFWQRVFVPIQSVCCLIRANRLAREHRISSNLRRIGLASTSRAARQAY